MTEDARPVRRRAARVGRIQLKYDAAQTTPSNARHWANADGLSPIESNSEPIRQLLRNRARYEIANDTIAQGIIDTLVDDTIGTGPRLQITSDEGFEDIDELVEHKFREWARKNKLSEKSRLLRRTKVATGEAFAVLARAQGSTRRAATIFNEPEVEIGIQLVEADQVATPDLFLGTDKVSGIEFDQYGNPTWYHILHEHPGSGSVLGATDYDRVPADMVVHWFKKNRPGDARGIPEITPALELFALRRRYTLATCEAAEHIANIAGMMQTDAPADGEAIEGGSEEDDTAFDTVDFARGQIMTLPFGWKYVQADPKQPTATFVQFQHELIGQIARCLNMPFNIAAGNSSSYNYASGRLDHQTYRKTIEVERSSMIDTVLDPIFDAWFAEASRTPNYLPQKARTETYRRALRTRWFFDGAGHVDPVKEAQGQAIRIANGTTTLAIESATQGHDWRDIAKQRAKEAKFYADLGLPLPGATETASQGSEESEDQEDQATRSEGTR